MSGTGTGAIVAGPGFVLRFADGEGFHFPDALTIDGTDVMGHDPAAGCFDEDEAGLVIAPTPRISAHGGAVPVMNRLVLVLRGPAVAQVRLEWATRFACNSARAPGGTSTFTVFPDGRIVRYDVLADPSSVPITAIPCSCGALSQQINVVAYWTFAGPSFHTFYVAGDPDRGLPTPDLIANRDVSCIADPARQIAFAWPIAKDAEISSSNALVRFGRTLSDVGAPMLEDFAFDNRSAIFIEHAPEAAAGCLAARTRAEEYVTPPHLFIHEDLDNKDIEVSPALDGIYGGGKDGGYVQPGVPVSGRVELTGAVTSPFAVWLRFPRSVDALRATLADATVPSYLAQRVDDRAWIVWFRDPLSAAQKIVIEPR